MPGGNIGYISGHQWLNIVRRKPYYFLMRDTPTSCQRLDVYLLHPDWNGEIVILNLILNHVHSVLLRYTSNSNGEVRKVMAYSVSCRDPTADSESSSE